MLKNKRHEMDGYITVYFSLILVILIAVLCTTLESARFVGVRLRCQSCAQLGIESLFADFYSPILEEYGLLMLDAGYGGQNSAEYEEKLKKYVENNLNPSENTWINGIDLFPARFSDLKIVRRAMATDFGGYALEQQMVEVAKEDTADQVIEWLLGAEQQVQQNQVLGSFFKKINEMEPAVKRVDYAVKDMAEQIEGIQKYRDNFEEKVEKAEELAEKWLDAQEEEEEGSGREDKYKKRLEKKIGELEEEQEKLLAMTQNALKKEDAYLAATSDIREQIQIVRSQLQEEFGDEGKENREYVEVQLDELERYAGGKEDYYLVEEKAELLRNNEGILKDNLEHLSEIEDGRDALSALKKCKREWRFYEKENLELNFQRGKGQGSNTGVIERLKSIWDQDFMQLLLGERELSDLKMNAAELPSEKSEEHMEWEDDSYTTQQNLMRAVLVDEYILNYFFTATQNEEKRALAYEAEYIYGGDRCDRKNLEIVVRQLLVIRSGLNGAALLQDSKKCEEAMTMASVLTGWTGMYGVIKVTQLLILGAWAYAESLLDVHALLNGKKVPFYKSTEDFTISLENLLSLKKGELIQEKGEQKGVSYEDYLRLLLSGVKRSERIYRCMDLIQENIRKNRNENFRIENCITALKAEINFSAEPIFLKLRVIQKEINHADSYELSGKVVYSYNKWENFQEK